MDKRIRLEFVAFTAIGLYILYYPFINGEIHSFIYKSYILLPFTLVFLGLLIITYRFKEVFKLFSSLFFLFFNSQEKDLIDIKVVKSSIVYSYVAGVLWALYAVSINNIIISEVGLSGLISQISVSILYAFVLSEFLLRPLKHKIEDQRSCSD